MWERCLERLYERMDRASGSRSIMEQAPEKIVVTTRPGKKTMFTIEGDHFEVKRGSSFGERGL